MAIDKIQSESINLADNFAFTGTVTGAGGVNTPAFMAYRNSTLAISHATWTVIVYDTEVFDSNGAYDPSTNYRFTIPTGEGGTYLFFFAAKIRSDTLHQLRAADILLRKNGSTICSNNSNYNQKRSQRRS